MSHYLTRADSPFGGSVWRMIDDAVVGAARPLLAGRRLLDLEGPYGFGTTMVSVGDVPVGEEGKAIARTPRMIPLTLLEEGFRIPVRDIASFERSGMPFDLSTVAKAAMNVAIHEDDLLFHGSPEAGVDGLLTMNGTLSVETDWETTGSGVDSVLRAVNALDDAGFHGPYTLALAPGQYNRLFRRYPDSDLTERMHLEQIITGGIVKAPLCQEGGLVIAVGASFASIVLGQDLATGFIGPAGGDYAFFIVESVALRVRRPDAVCILK